MRHFVRGGFVFDIVEAIHKALRIESTWVFVLFIALGCGVVGGFLAWIIDTGYKNSPEYRTEHQKTEGQTTVQAAVQTTESKSQTESSQEDKNKNTKSSKVHVKNGNPSGTDAKTKGDTGGAKIPSGVVVQPGAVASFGQQGGITAGQVVIASDDAVPTRVSWSQESIAPVNPSTFPYSLKVTITPNKRIDAPTLGLIFDGPVEVPDIPFTAMSAGNGGIGNDPNTVWVFWNSPSLTPERPAVFTVESAAQVRLLRIEKGPKPPF